MGTRNAVGSKLPRSARTFKNGVRVFKLGSLTLRVSKPGIELTDTTARLPDASTSVASIMLMPVEVDWLRTVLTESWTRTTSRRSDAAGTR